MRIFRDRVYLKNAIALSLMWGVSCYSYYFTEFYMKYVPVDNIYLLAVLMGLADILGSFCFKILVSYFPAKRILGYGYIVLSVIALGESLCLWFGHGSEFTSVIFSLLICGMRLFSSLTFIICYYANN